jgi:hypothetical protein
MRISGRLETKFGFFCKGFRVLTAAVVLASAGNAYGSQETANPLSIGASTFLPVRTHRASQRLSQRTDPADKRL